MFVLPLRGSTHFMLKAQFQMLVLLFYFPKQYRSVHLVMSRSRSRPSFFSAEIQNRRITNWKRQIQVYN